MKKEDKRSRLIQAAYTVFSEKGYAAASIKDVAEAAEITPGLVHYYFRSKEDLLFAVQSEVQKRYHEKYENWADKDITLEETLVEIRSRLKEMPEWYKWRYELFSLGMKQEQMRERVASVLDEGRNSLAEPLKEFLHLREDIEPLAGILLACFDGLALQKLMNDSFDIERAFQLLHDMIEQLLDQSQASKVDP